MSASWSWQKINQLRRLWPTDMRKKDIAILLHTSVGHLYRVARRNGLEIEVRKAERPKREMPAYVPPPGWPTKAQLMGRR